MDSVEFSELWNLVDELCMIWRGHHGWDVATQMRWQEIAERITKLDPSADIEVFNYLSLKLDLKYAQDRMPPAVLASPLPAVADWRA